MKNSAVLAKNEFVLLRRTPSYLLFGVLLPLILAGDAFRSYSPDAPLDKVIYTTEMYLVVALAMQVLVVPAMALTNRRDLGFLLTLRCTEASRLEILTSLFIPGAFLTLLFFTAGTVALVTMGYPVYFSPLSLIFGLGFSLSTIAAVVVIITGLTKSVESAQFTVIPGILLLALAPAGTLREVLPAQIQQIIQYTPFVAAFDLLAQRGSMAVNFTVCVMWLIGLVLIAQKVFRWGPRG